MADGQWNPTIQQGASWTRTLTYADEGVPIDLSGYTARMDIAHPLSGRAILELDTDNQRIVIDGPAGTIALILSTVDTASLSPQAYRYNIELVADPDPRSETAAVQRLI